jgi:transcriptional regulator with XRE-family HTH domain
MIIDFTGAFSASTPNHRGGVTAVVVLFHVANNAAMPRSGKHANEAPGCNVFKYRTARGISQRALAEKCRPGLDHTTIRRLELNLGYTQDTLERVARALGVSIQDLFLPPELADWADLPVKSRQRIVEAIQDAAAAYRFRKSN